MLREQLEQWSKIGVAGVAIVYVLGFVVHTLYLGAYGMAAVNLLRAQYVLAGVWLLAPLALIGGAAALIVYLRELNVDEHHPRTPPHEYAVIIVLYIGGWVVAAWPLRRYFSTPPDVELSDVKWLVIILACLVTVAVMTCALGSPRKITFTKGLGVGVVVIVLFFAYTSRFAVVVYPAIASAAGGGGPATVRFVVDANGVLPIDPKQPYPLLVATEHSIIVLNDGKATEISRDKVKAVLYEPPPR